MMPQSKSHQQLKTELAIALDFSTAKDAESLMQELKGLSVIYKVGLELFLSAGPAWVKALCEGSITGQRERVFLDLKFYDIPNTVAHAVKQAAELGVEFTTVHLSGGKKMFDEILKINQAKKVKILGVSILTSFSAEEWQESVARTAAASLSIKDSVLNFANFANDHEAIFGIVCSPQEIKTIRAKHADLFLLVPGIRPEGSAQGDQARVMTPAQAAQAGASVIVVGRPITQVKDSRKVAEEILNQLKRTH